MVPGATTHGYARLRLDDDHPRSDRGEMAITGLEGTLGAGRFSSPNLRRRAHALVPGSRAAVAALGIGVALAILQICSVSPFAVDAAVYYYATPGALYSSDWGSPTAVHAAFLYSPAFADALIPLRALPLAVFQGLFQLAIVAALVVTIRGWALVALAAALPFLVFGVARPLTYVLGDVALGNIEILLGCVAVWGLRWPGLWAFALLSKVTPGIGVLWFAVRREWRQLAIALGVTVLIAGASFAWKPGDWFAWIQFLWTTSLPHYDGVLPVALPVRLAVAAALVVWGARTDRAWILPIAVGLSIPIPYLSMAAAMVCAIGTRPLAARRGLPSQATIGIASIGHSSSE